MSPVWNHSIHKHLILCLHLAEILGGRPFLIITSFQHFTNSSWVSVLVSTVCPLPRHGHFSSVFPPATRSTMDAFHRHYLLKHNLLPTKGSVLSNQSLLSTKSFCLSTNRHVTNTTEPFIPEIPSFHTSVVLLLVHIRR